MTFFEFKKGMRGRIVNAPCDTVVAIRLQEMGLTPGAEFTVTKIAPLGDPVEIDLRGYRLCLRRAETIGFEAEVVES